MNKTSDETQNTANPEGHKLPEYCRGLNKVQQQALLHFGSPLLILAGAGSGKTRVITTKIAYLVDVMNVDPRSILGVTFTNKAAGEMRERVAAMVPEAEQVMLRTFHSFGAWVLRRNSEVLGLDPHFTIYDDDDSLNLLSTISPGYTKKDLKPFARRISRAKDYCLSPDSDLLEISSDPRFPQMFTAYENKLRALGNVDFGDLILRCLELLQDNPEVKQRLHSRFKVILVDEYQDSNVAQFNLLRELAGPDTYLCVVGDDDQSIYRFRGAEVRNILSFHNYFPGTQTIRLEENYRSTGNILAIAGAVVENNQGRLGKNLWTRKESGKKGVLAFLEDPNQEALFCAQLVSDGNYAGTAVLYRTNAQSAVFETVFSRMGIPYQVVGALRFYEREEVKDAFALIALFLNPKDEIAFRRIINKPARGIGPKSAAEIVETARETAGNLLEACRIVGGRKGKDENETGNTRPEGAEKQGLNKRSVNSIPGSSTGLTKKAVQGVGEFWDCFNYMEDHVNRLELSKILAEALRLSGLYGYNKEQDEDNYTQKTGNLQEVVNAAAAYEPGKAGLLRYLEDMELDRSRIAAEKYDGSMHQKGVTLITMHSTKGLEFERVIDTGLEEGIFPGRNEDELEEERRIFYVAITRAKKEIYFTACRKRTIWGRTDAQRRSRFLDEIPLEHVDVCNGSSGSGVSGGLQRGGYFGK